MGQKIKSTFIMKLEGIMHVQKINYVYLMKLSIIYFSKYKLKGNNKKNKLQRKFNTKKLTFEISFVASIISAVLDNLIASIFSDNEFNWNIK